MPRCFVPLLLAAAPLAAVAAPVPREETKIQRAYGTWADPHRDCGFKLAGGELRVSLPAAARSLNTPFGGPANAPRALREVDGDFAAVVRVAGPVPERVPKVLWPYCSGGLLAWEGERAFVVVRRCVGLVNGHPEAVWQQHTAAATDAMSVQGFRTPAGAAFVRLRRGGNRVTTGWSRDGKEWTDFAPVDVAWGRAVRVGVVAENLLGAAAEVTFDQYRLSRPKE